MESWRSQQGTDEAHPSMSLTVVPLIAPSQWKCIMTRKGDDWNSAQVIWMFAPQPMLREIFGWALKRVLLMKSEAGEDI